MCQFPVSASIADWLLRGKLQLKKKKTYVLQTGLSGISAWADAWETVINVCGSESCLLIRTEQQNPIKTASQ